MKPLLLLFLVILASSAMAEAGFSRLDIPLGTFSYDGQYLSDAKISSVDERGVRIEGKGKDRRSEATIIVPIIEAKKMPQLRMKLATHFAELEQREKTAALKREEWEQEKALIEAGYKKIWGRVLSVLPDGVLVQMGDDVMKLITKGDYADNETVKVFAKSTGERFQYTTAAGGLATVRVFYIPQAAE